MFLLGQWPMKNPNSSLGQETDAPGLLAQKILTLAHFVGCTAGLTYPYGKSLLESPIARGYLCFFHPQESLENTINTMGTLLGVHPIVPWRSVSLGVTKCHGSVPLDCFKQQLVKVRWMVLLIIFSACPFFWKCHNTHWNTKAKKKITK